jgi:alkanesulfonate monooxygenase SsuD/methylene tetrahydromethanopterin reductase-like flavin-dependent oxidoreductase (luciferase family)
MKFSIIYEAQTVDTTPEAEFRVFHEMVEQSLLAEKVGFDCIWAVEHTALTQYAHMSAPETFLAFLAGKTDRIHIGHGVVCLPPHMNHPVKVAERIATLDILSKGRLEFGMGKGGSQQEAGTFGYDLKTLQPMIDEAMYLIPKIMTQEYIEHSGHLCADPPPADLSEALPEAASEALLRLHQPHLAGADRQARHRRTGAGAGRA